MFMHQKVCWQNKIFLSLVCFVIGRHCLLAQQNNCSFKEPVVLIDFGNSNVTKEINLSALQRYKKSTRYCPDDGYFAFTPYTIGCFGNKWHTLQADHTGNDTNGKMMVVNAAQRPGAFFIYKITGLTPGSRYEISSWIVNICRYADGCNPTPPVITFAIESGGKPVAKFETGAINITNDPIWKRYAGVFTLPVQTDAITIKMEDITNGGCGNDFAIDDIMIRECTMQQTVISTNTDDSKLEIPEKTITGGNNVPAKEPIKSSPVAPTKATITKKQTNQQNTSTLTTNKKPVPLVEEERVDKPMETTPVVIIEKKVSTPAPNPIITRANPVIKKIETDETILVIDLYDNGEIDGDTVSIYHNNELEVYRAGLSAKPITLKIKVDEQHPHHELVMVAENLGSIPPNTSLMIVTANNKRYEIFISSSEQKNAKLIIDLKQN
jgi:hypothetical protein